MHQTIDGKLFCKKCFLQILKVVVELERNGGEFLKRPDDIFYAQDEWSTIRVEWSQGFKSLVESLPLFCQGFS